MFILLDFSGVSKNVNSLQETNVLTLGTRMRSIIGLGTSSYDINPIHFSCNFLNIAKYSHITDRKLMKWEQV